MTSRGRPVQSHTNLRRMKGLMAQKIDGDGRKSRKSQDEGRFARA
jgi:hypothetical protein